MVALINSIPQSDSLSKLTSKLKEKKVEEYAQKFCSVHVSKSAETILQRVKYTVCWFLISLGRVSYTNKQQNEAAMVHKGLTFPGILGVNGRLEAAWTDAPLYAGGETRIQRQTSRSDHLIDILKTTCLTGHTTVSLQVRITWGEAKDPLKSIWTILQGRKLIAHSDQSGCWPPKFNSYFHFSNQPKLCFPKIQKTLALPGRVQRLTSRSQNVQALRWCSISVVGVNDKDRGQKVTKTMRGI